VKVGPRRLLRERSRPKERNRGSAGGSRWDPDDGTRYVAGLGDRPSGLTLVTDFVQLRKDLADPAVWIEPHPDLVDRVASTISAAAKRQRVAPTVADDVLTLMPAPVSRATPRRDVQEPASTRVGPSTGFEVRVLGPVEVVWDGRLIDIGGAKARSLVARMLVDRGLVISVDRLVDSLWTDHEGNGTEIALRSTISRLRKRVRDADATGQLITTRPPGYVLDLPASAIDASRFEQLVSEARRQLGRRRPSVATRLLNEAQGLWRGPAYSDVCDEPFARAEARRLEELLLTAIETRIDAQLTMGLHDDVVGELEALTSANPLRERLWSQRMLALYRSGRQGEALRVSGELRRILVDELGIEPGHDVTWLEHAILEQDPALHFPVPPERSETVEPIPVTVPAYQARVPAGPNEGPLIGREREFTQLRHWWNASVRGAAELLLVDGGPGIGKTRLVAELARSLESEGVLVLWGRCDEDPIAPFQPFAEALGRYFQSVSVDQLSRLPEWQITELARLVLPLREHVPMIEEESGDPETERFRFFGALTQTLNGLSARGPVLLVLDDLHWAEQPTLLLLRHILRSADAVNLGVLAMYIDSEVPSKHHLRPLLTDLRSNRSAATVHLEGLSEAAVQELAELAAAPELASQLFNVTGGNPMFLEEMLRQLGDGDESETSVPPNLNPTEAIRELVARRVSRLPEDVIYLLQAASVAGTECEAALVAEAAELTAEQRLDALDLAEESKLLRHLGGRRDLYAFSHSLVRDAIYNELLRGRRVRYHHKVALATERAHGDELEHYVNELAHHFYMGAALDDSDKAIRYGMAAGEHALRLLAFEEAVGHFTRSLEVAEQFGDHDQSLRCDALLALAEAQNRAGDNKTADANFERAVVLARAIGDPERLATAALRAGPLSGLGIVVSNAEQLSLLQEALELLPQEDSRLRAMVMARLGLVLIYSAPIPERDVVNQALQLDTEAVQMARRLNDRGTLAFALNSRIHALWGISAAPERLAAGLEVGEIAAGAADELLALHGHMWRVRELLTRGDIEAVNVELLQFATRDTGPPHPLLVSLSSNLAAMLALVSGEFDAAEWWARTALETGQGYNDMAFPFYGVLMAWTWWQRDDLKRLGKTVRSILAQAGNDLPILPAAMALILAEEGDAEASLAQLDFLADLGWERVGYDLTEGVSLTCAAAACGTLGQAARHHAPSVYEVLRPLAGTVVVLRAPGAACVGPADQYLGLLAVAMDDLALAEVHFEAALRLARQMRAEPFVVGAEVELGRTLRQRGREGDEERVAVLLRHAEESAVAMGLHRLVRRAATPD
jgi:DNA-binding SARP family transcriptional activator/tetratricopeptide (TPR) repeat protein